MKEIIISDEGERVLLPLTKGCFAIIDAKDYEELSSFRWTADVRKNGKIYARRNQRRGYSGKLTKIYLHRQLLDVQKGEEVDHINGDGLDNRRCNLRRVNHQQNLMNQVTQKRDKSSKYKGVYYNKNKDDVKKWSAQIKINRNTIFLGYFNDERQAAAAYNEAATQCFGVYARENAL